MSDERRSEGGGKGKAAKPGEENLTGQLERVDRLLEHRVRLAICVLLSRYDRLSFSRFKELTGETDGNLGANLRRLEDEDYLEVTKEFMDRRPVSWYSLTEKGRGALESHLDAVTSLIEGAEV